MLTVTACDPAPEKNGDAEGKKLQVAPPGSPLQERFTIPEKDPLTLTWKPAVGVVVGFVLAAVVRVEGEGAVRLKSTTCRVTDAACEVCRVSVPIP